MNKGQKYFFITLIFTFPFITLLSQTITKENIENAEKIIGIEFTDAERDSMQTSLDEQLTYYDNIRKVKLANNVPPAILFNPIPVGFESPKEQNPVIFSDYSYTKLPEDINDLAFYSIGELAELIKTKQITSTQLTKFFLERLKKYDAALHCVITFTEERAMNQAELMDAEIAEGKYRGLLHGIPFGVKDLLATKDYKTTWGSVPFKDQMIEEDATVIKKLEDAGAVLCVKLTLGELAWGDVWFGGKTRNPMGYNKRFKRFICWFGFIGFCRTPAICNRH
jgi:hypothetical protein